MTELYELLHERMRDEVAGTTGLLVDEDVQWSELADLHIAAVD